jgi:hypothetical protein
LHVCKTKILDEHTQGPAIGNRMMYREDEHMVIGPPSKDLGSVKRALNWIERLVEYPFCKLFDRIVISLRSGKLAEPDIGFARLPKHLYRPIFTRQEREAQNLLPVHYALKRGLPRLQGNDAPQLNKAADMVRVVCDTNRRRLPQFPLRECQRLEACLSARQPLLEKDAFVSGHLRFFWG